MYRFTIKKSSGMMVAFLTAYFFMGFISFAIVLVFFYLYLIVTTKVDFIYIRRAGVPELSAIFLVGLLSTVALSPFPFSAWNIGKDMYFFSAPIIMLVSGLTFLKNPRDLDQFLVAAIKTLTIISIVMFSDFLLSGAIFSISLDTRYNYFMDSSASTVALLLIIALRPTLKSLLGSSTLSVLAMMNLFLIIASLSRVNLSIALLSLVFVYSSNRFVRNSILIFIIVLITTPFLQLPHISQMGSTSGEFGFFGKVLNSLQEMEISNYSELADINQNWRGYEAYLGMERVFQVGGWANIIGIGFGSYAEGPFDNKLTEIPFFHNGYVTIFLKSGALGLAVFITFIAKLFIRSRSAFKLAHKTADPLITRAALIIVLLTISIVIRTLSTHGVYYSKPIIELFFIGISIYVWGSFQRSRQWRNDPTVTAAALGPCLSAKKGLQ